MQQFKMLFTPKQRAFFAKMKAERKAYNEREDVIQMKKEKKKEYRAREDVKQRTRENNANKPPFNCECGSTVIVGGKSKHLKTKKHLDFIDSKEKE